MMMAVLQVNALNSMHDDEIDALSSDDDSTESSMDFDYVKGPKTQVKDYEGFEQGFDADDPIAQQMESIISLKISLGIDNDKEFLAEHEKKKAVQEKERIEKEKEEERIANMTIEERIEYESRKNTSLIAGVASNFLTKKRDELQQKYQWEKPEWATKKALRSTTAGQAVKQGADLQAPITQAPQLKKTKEAEGDGPKPKLKRREAEAAPKKNIEWEKPDWAKKSKLKSTAAGDAVKKGVDLQAPITQAPHLKKSAPAEEEEGEEGGVAPARKLKTPGAPAAARKDIGWEKPEWAKKSKLRTTTAGEAVKKGVDLQGPITQAPHIKQDTQAEVMSFLKKNVKKAKPGVGGAADSPTKGKKPKVRIAGDDAPKTPKKDNDTQAEVMDFLKKSMKKAKSKRNLMVSDD